MHIYLKHLQNCKRYQFLNMFIPKKQKYPNNIFKDSAQTDRHTGVGWGVAGSPRDEDYNDPRHYWCCRGTHGGGPLRFTASARCWSQVHLHGSVVLRQHANDRHRSASTFTEYSLSCHPTVTRSDTVSINTNWTVIIMSPYTNPVCINTEQWVSCLPTLIQLVSTLTELSHYHVILH